MENVFSTSSLIEASGVYIYPLGLCSFLAMFIIIERLMALRSKRVLADSFLDALLSSDVRSLKGDDKTAGGRIFNFYKKYPSDKNALKSFLELEVSRMERGMFILDIVIAGAPLIGLIGTVHGLIDVFGIISPNGGMPDSQLFMKGVALALSTTMIGLLVTIPAIAGNSYLNRKIDVQSTRLSVAVDRMMALFENEEKSS